MFFSLWGQMGNLKLKSAKAVCPTNRHCSEWAIEYLDYCLCNVKDGISLSLGLLSVVSWAVAEIPQIITNYKQKSAEGISIAFLITWIVGYFSFTPYLVLYFLFYFFFLSKCLFLAITFISLFGFFLIPSVCCLTCVGFTLLFDYVLLFSCSFLNGVKEHFLTYLR